MKDMAQITLLTQSLSLPPSLSLSLPIPLSLTDTTDATSVFDTDCYTDSKAASKVESITTAPLRGPVRAP